VLLLVLVLVATTIGAVYAFARITLLGVASARQRVDRTRAELLARTSLDLARRALFDDQNSPEPVHSQLDSAEDAWAVLSREPIVDPDTGMRVSIRIRDGGQRIDLNALLDEQGRAQQFSAPFLRDALDKIIEQLPGRTEDKRYETRELSEAILDWIDSDTETRLGDEEAEFYTDQRAEALPIDRPLLSLSELEGIPGLDRTLLDALDAYFAPSLDFPRSGGGGGLNPNTAPPYLLAMLYLVASESDTRFVEDDDVFRVLRAREDGQLFCPGDAAAVSERCTDFGSTIGRGETIFPPIRFSSESFAIDIEARADAAEARACVQAVFSRRAPDEGGGLLSYRLGC